MGTDTYMKYPKECTFNGKRVLNLGCGFTVYPAENVVNLDKFSCCSPDVEWDLEKTPLPFKDEEFDYILANHVMEHIHNWWDLFKDCSRILKTGGVMDIFVPGLGSDSQLGFRDHVSFISPQSFYGVSNNRYRFANAWAHEQTSTDAARMNMVSVTHVLEPGFKHMPKFVQKFATKYLRNCVVEDHYQFIKEPRHG